MSTPKLSKYKIERRKLNKIASKIMRGKRPKKKIKGIKYQFFSEKKRIAVRMMKTKKIINSEMSYDASEGNQFNIALYLSKMVKMRTS